MGTPIPAANVVPFPNAEGEAPLDEEQQIQVDAEAELETEDLEKDFPEDLVNAIRFVVDSMEKPEQPNREVILRECKKLLSYWVGIQRIWWDASRQDYRFINDTDEDNATTLDFREDTINYYRPYGEATIAALGASVPHLLWAPSDADNPDDILKAKAFGKITELLEIQNNLPLQILRMLYILWNQHFCATRIYPEVDPKNGTVLFPKYVEKSKIIVHEYCPECMVELGEHELDETESDDEKFTEALTGEEPGEGLNEGLGLIQCPKCGSMIEPETDQETVNYEEFDSYDPVHKAKIKIDCYGPLNVKIPLIARSQEEIPYLIFESELDVNVAKARYPHVKDKIQPQTGEESFDRWARTTIDYNHAYPTQACTIREIWLTPAAFEALGNRKTEYYKLKKLFPKGACLVFIGRLFVEAYEAEMDKHWKISRNPVAEYLHAMPLGRMATSVQEMQTELLDLTMATIEQGIPEMFVDPQVLDFESYRNVRKEPGLVFPIKRRNPNENLSQSFFESRTSTLSKDVPDLQARLDQVGQFVTSALPSVWGGAIKGGSGTLGEYEQSRAMALQRLGIVWKIVNDLYSRTLDSAARMFESYMLEDEKFAKQVGNSWLSIYIKKSEMNGNVGNVFSQSTEQFPVSWDQKTARIFELLNMKDPNLNAIIFHPDNAFFFARALGLPELFVPGDAERNKQLVEIGKLLITSDQMQQIPGPMGMQIISSVPIEPMVDDDVVHIGVLQAWANSEIGQMTKENDPQAYQNVMAHMQEHLTNQQSKMMAQQPPPPEEANAPVQE